MPTTLEYPWNGIVVAGSKLPGPGVPVFANAVSRGIDRIRVMLDPRVVMPPTTGALSDIPVEVYGSDMDANQSRNARTIIQTTYARGLTRKAAQMALATAIVEAQLYILANPNVPFSLDASIYSEGQDSTGTSVGIMQQEVGDNRQYSNTLSNVRYLMDVANSTNLFLDRLTAVPNYLTIDPGTAIQDAQDSDVGAISSYNAQMDEADAILTSTGYPAATGTIGAGTTIPTAVQTALVALADATRPVPGNAQQTDVQIEWCLDAAVWPVTATTSRRPRVGDLTTFWGAMNDLVGSHAGTWGFSLMNSPTVALTGTANQDPHASMTAYKDATWTGTVSATASAWLQALTKEVVDYLRADDFEGIIAIPTMYSPGHLRTLSQHHSGGPWLDDTNVYYETALFPGVDNGQITQNYAGYRTWATSQSAAYRASWVESVYFTQASGTATVIDPDPLAIPLQELLPADPNADDPIPPAPPELLTITESDAAVAVTWAASTFDGGAAIIGYRVTATGDGSVIEVTVAADVLAATVGPLVNDVEYIISVVALNSVGASEPSNTLLATPEEGLDPVDPPPEPPVEPEPPVIIVPAPNIFAFYPDGVNGSLGAFSPDNWAGL